ncbi:MAG: ABC transporter ATP-binding protein [Solirubrobacteraceae bacterium]|nr:ABC transporter ATP-binding protein [Solirubrobacteraceae bacterium]
MSASEIAVAVEGVSKDFRLASERRQTLKERVVNPRFDREAKVFHVLKDLDFDIKRGEFFGIVGRNGSGKSTLLKCLAGIYQLDKGKISIAGRLSTFIELGVGFNPDLAARDNIVLNGIMLGLSPKQAAARVDQVIAFAELEDHVDLKLKNYSSGMQVRLAFSVLTQVDADVLLIDEVLAVGDAAFQAKCFQVFRQLSEAGKTIVLVTHDMSSVARLCDRAMLLEDGVMKAIGDPEEVAEQYLSLQFENEVVIDLPMDTPADDEEEGENEHEGPPPVPQRPGNHRAQLVNMEVLPPVDYTPVRHLKSGDSVRLVTDVVLHSPISGGTVELTIRSEDGIDVFSAKRPIDADIPVGDVWQFVVLVALPLRQGRYTLSGTIVEKDGLEIVDRHRDAVAFEITNIGGQDALVALPWQEDWIHRYIDYTRYTDITAVIEQQLDEFVPNKGS